MSEDGTFRLPELSTGEAGKGLSRSQWWQPNVHDCRSLLTLACSSPCAKKTCCAEDLNKLLDDLMGKLG
ncbi:hypothetical protein TNCV_670921 [Trichonephila clavipes]|nr:hypothetical protein TNCV_670921 [Trichonephila clavipes]